MSIPLLSLTGSSLLCRPAVCRFSFLSPLLLLSSFFSSPSSVGFPATLFSSTVSRNEVYVQSPANRTHPFQCVLFSDLLCIYFYPTRALYPILYERRIYTRMTHACSRPSFLFLFCFFLFPTRFFQTRTISSFFFYGSIHSTTVNFFFFFFASLYLPGYFVTCSSLYSSCVQFFLLFVSSWFHKFAQKLNFQRGRRRRGRPRRRKRNVGCAHSCDHGTSWSGGGDISTRYGSDTRFRASLEPSEREKRGKTGEKKKESKRARRCL